MKLFGYLSYGVSKFTHKVLSQNQNWSRLIPKLQLQFSLGRQTSEFFLPSEYAGRHDISTCHRHDGSQSDGWVLRESWTLEGNAVNIEVVISGLWNEYQFLTHQRRNFDTVLINRSGKTSERCLSSCVHLTLLLADAFPQRNEVHHSNGTALEPYDKEP